MEILMIEFISQLDRLGLMLCLFVDGNHDLIVYGGLDLAFIIITIAISLFICYSLALI